MCNFSPSATAAARATEFSPETMRAFEEMRLAIAKRYDVDPDTVQLVISRSVDYDTIAQRLSDTEVFDA